MATFNTYDKGDTTIVGGGNAAGYPGVTALVGEFDASRRNLAAADIVEIINVPAGTIVNSVVYEVLVGEATQTLSIGDATAATGYVAAADVGTTGNSGKGGGALAVAVGPGKYYAAADTIDITVPAGKAYTVLKIRVTAFCSIAGISG